MSVLLGAIADDFTGATDLAGTLVGAGMRTVQMIGIPAIEAAEIDADADAVVIALKSRTCSSAEAVDQSLGALRWLQAAGCRQFFFKYCSTFDSTPEGNIGPVMEALLDALQVDFTIACPAFPRNKRLVFMGHLFVGGVPLNESGMQNHPLTPMTDANLVRVLDGQTRGAVGLVAHDAVGKGVAEITAAYQRLRGQGIGMAIVDAVDDGDLQAIGSASAELVLITGGSGVAIGLPENFRRQGLLKTTQADALPKVGGKAAVISGSCSRATREQVDVFGRDHPAFRIDPLSLAKDGRLVGQALEWAARHLADGPLLIYASAEPGAVKEAHDRLGVERASRLVEEALATIAKGLVGLGVGRLVIAGGETAGAVVKALGISGFLIGAEIDLGVPCTVSLGEKRLALALKSGNFGTADFFAKALRRLP